MSDFADLRALALKITEKLEQTNNQPAATLPSKTSADTQSFLNRIEADLGRPTPLTPEEIALLTYVFERNSALSPDEAAERVAWIARGPNAFYWGPWFPYQDP